MRDRSGRVPWLLVAGTAMLTVLLFYVLFAAYFPARQRVARLEAEVKDVYAREAALQNQLERGERQAQALIAERDALRRRVETLQRELDARRPVRGR